MLTLLLATHLFYPSHTALARYDFLTIAALMLQIAMLALRPETLEEARVILAFHIAGTIMELFKTAHGSWQYPEVSVLHIGGVPLFSGFMYASVGSYIARVWRIFDFRYSHFPAMAPAAGLAIAIYVNFFAHHWLIDMRLPLFAGMVWLFRRTNVHFRNWRARRHMPLLVGWGLVALFIWFAENIATFSHAWAYPSQSRGWAMVPPTKLGAWYLLMYLSFMLVAVIHPPRPVDGD